MRIPVPLILIFACLAAISTSAPSWAAHDIFMNAEGIPGQTNDSAHEGWIGLTSFSHGLARPCGQTTDFSEFVFNKELDLATPKLYFAANTGQVQRELEVHVHLSEADQPLILKYVFQNALFHSGATAINGGAFETWSFSFSEAVITYTRLDQDGNPVETESVTLIVGPCSPQ